jgi:uncharacterized RDD family membrane protein YckC
VAGTLPPPPPHPPGQWPPAGQGPPTHGAPSPGPPGSGTPGYGASPYPGYPGYAGQPGYGPPPGWAYVAPTYATRLGLVPASFGQRLGAHLLDLLILGIASLPVWIVGIWFVASNWEEEPGTCLDRRGFEYRCQVATNGSVGRLFLALFVGFVVMLVVSVFYWGHYEGRRGASPGKKAVGICVVRQETGLPIGFGRAVGRVFAQYLSSQVLYLGYLWMLWDDNKQTWHDKIVGSIVVKAPQ